VMAQPKRVPGSPQKQSQIRKSSTYGASPQKVTSNPGQAYALPFEVIAAPNTGPSPGLELPSRRVCAVQRPIPHERPPLLEQIPTPVGCLGLITDRVSQRH